MRARGNNKGEGSKGFKRFLHPRSILTHSTLDCGWEGSWKNSRPPQLQFLGQDDANDSLVSFPYLCHFLLVDVYQCFQSQVPSLTMSKIVPLLAGFYLENFFWGEALNIMYGRGPLGARRFCEECCLCHPPTHLVLFLVTTSTSPSLQAYAELHALFSEGVYKPLAMFNNS